MSPDTQKMNHACGTANDYMMAAIRQIDAQFGDGFAHQHPELIAGFMTTAAIDYATNFVLIELGTRLDAISDALDK